MKSKWDSRDIDANGSRVEDAEATGRKKNKSDQLDANEMASARDIWGGLTRRALL